MAVPFGHSQPWQQSRPPHVSWCAFAARHPAQRQKKPFFLSSAATFLSLRLDSRV